MYFKHKLWLLVLVSCCLFEESLSRNDNPRNGDYKCIACTAAVGLVEQISQYNNGSIAQAVTLVCKYLPNSEIKYACEAIVNMFGPVVIDLLYMKETPDVICHTLKFCYTDPGQKKCQLFPMPLKGTFYEGVERSQHVLKKHVKSGKVKFPDINTLCKIPGISYVCDLVYNMETTFRPMFDLDYDGFSVMETLRGSDWRGRDCNDFKTSIYPGRKPHNHDIEYDSNCNGIYGVDTETKIPYEDLFCNNSGSQGVMVLGDSASAHFHIPKEWVMPDKLGKDVFAHLPYVLENQMDWPMMSAVTGFKNVTWPIIEGPVQSLYMNLRERNRCNHRDYQNLAVNGADSIQMLQYQLSLVRDKFLDKPVTLMYALVGNDVCNGRDDTLANMTTVEMMRSNIMKTLNFLDDILPKGSHIILTGLADGTVLYDLLKDKKHPLSGFNQYVGYPELYDYLNCLGISPCTGWMNTNATIRDLTSERAANLSNVLEDVATKFRYNFSSFELAFIGCPLNAVIKDWERDHGKGSAYLLIDPMDGFHPNQYAQALIAEWGWKWLDKYHPNFIGKPNPNNAKIKAVFGDQGGH